MSLVDGFDSGDVLLDEGLDVVEGYFFICAVVGEDILEFRELSRRVDQLDPFVGKRTFAFWFLTGTGEIGGEESALGWELLGVLELDIELGVGTERVPKMVELEEGIRYEGVLVAGH